MHFHTGHQLFEYISDNSMVRGMQHCFFLKSV